MKNPLLMAAGHLSTPYGGDAVLPEHLKMVLQQGTVFVDGLNPLQQELLHGFFSETPTSAVLECIKQSNASWDKVNDLYNESLDHLAYPVKDFEKFLEKHA